jgi:hypothetical protein
VEKTTEVTELIEGIRGNNRKFVYIFFRSYPFFVETNVFFSLFIFKDKLIMALKDGNRVNWLTEVPETKSEIATGRGQQFLARMGRTTGQFLVMT